MTFAGYYLKDLPEVKPPIVHGVPVGEPRRVFEYVLTDIIRDVPEGTPQEMVEEKWGPSNTSIKLMFSAESECPSEVKEQMLNPDPHVRQRVWSSL
jgi:hypothetical protein